jgi:hypothetical protein
MIGLARRRIEFIAAERHWCVTGARLGFQSHPQSGYLRHAVRMRHEILELEGIAFQIEEKPRRPIFIQDEFSAARSNPLPNAVTLVR